MKPGSLESGEVQKIEVPRAEVNHLATAVCTLIMLISGSIAIGDAQYSATISNLVSHLSAEQLQVLYVSLLGLWTSLPFLLAQGSQNVGEVLNDISDSAQKTVDSLRLELRAFPNLGSQWNRYMAVIKDQPQFKDLIVELRHLKTGSPFPVVISDKAYLELSQTDFGGERPNQPASFVEPLRILKKSSAGQTLIARIKHFRELITVMRSASVTPRDEAVVGRVVHEMFTLLSIIIERHSDTLIKESLILEKTPGTALDSLMVKHELSPVVTEANKNSFAGRLTRLLYEYCEECRSGSTDIEARFDFSIDDLVSDYSTTGRVNKKKSDTDAIILAIDALKDRLKQLEGEGSLMQFAVKLMQPLVSEKHQCLQVQITVRSNPKAVVSDGGPYLQTHGILLAKTYFDLFDEFYNGLDSNVPGFYINYGNSCLAKRP